MQYPPIPADAILDDYCTLALCPLSLAQVHYVPSLPGNALYTAIFVLVLALQLFLGIRYKTWGFMVGMCSGIILEVIGYIARIQMHSNPFKQDPFLMYLITLTIGPAFLSGSIYLCLSRIVVAYSQSLSRLKPRTYTLTFMACDFLALVLQAAGGAIASTSETESDSQMGINIMIAGVSWQVFSLALFAGLCADFALTVRRGSHIVLNTSFDRTRNSAKFRGFLYALGVATLAIFIRSVFRCAELSQGFDGALANQETTFMILEGAMIIIAVVILTVFHPGVAFQGKWLEAAWSLRNPNRGAVIMEDLQPKR